MKASHFSEDVQEFLLLLHEYKVKYVIIGGEAVIYYGYPRFTGDVDFYFHQNKSNTLKLYKALHVFWDENIPGIHSISDLRNPDFVIQFGVPPNRIDLLNSLSNLDFINVWNSRKTEFITVNDTQVPVHYIGLQHLIVTKENAGRNKDLDDLDFLKKHKTI